MASQAINHLIDCLPTVFNRPLKKSHMARYGVEIRLKMLIYNE